MKAFQVHFYKFAPPTFIFFSPNGYPWDLEKHSTTAKVFLMTLVKILSQNFRAS